MTYARHLPIVFAAMALLASGASAQSKDVAPDCSTYFLNSEARFNTSIETAACARATVNRQMLINSIDVVPRVVAGSFGIGPTQVNPAGLSGLTADEFQQRMARGTAMVISPVADAAPATAAPALWNVWGDGKYTWNDNGPASFDMDGPLWNGMFGLDYKVTSKFTLGVMASYESSDLEGMGADLKSDGWGIGPYVGVVLTDNLVFSANALASKIDSSQFDKLFEFDSDRIQAAASLNGYWYQGTWRFNPGISLSWSKEWMEETAGFLADQTIETGLLSTAVQIGNTLHLSDQATVEPWAGAAFDYTFLNRTATDGFATVDDPYADIRLQAGLNFAFGSSTQLAVTGEYSGLLRDQSDSYSGEVNLAIQF